MPRFAIARTKDCLPDGLRPAEIIVAGEKIEKVVSLEDFAGDVPCEHLGDLMVSPGCFPVCLPSLDRLFLFARLADKCHLQQFS